jgi:hypothetical protein
VRTSPHNIENSKSSAKSTPRQNEDLLIKGRLSGSD